MAETKNAEFYQEVLDICLTAGRLMIEGGSEMYRVEDTMRELLIMLELRIQEYLRHLQVFL